MDYIKKFILGDYSLVKTFWILYFIPTVLYSIVREILLYNNENYSSPWVLIFLLMLYKILCVIAVWNSSTKYVGKKRWFYLVRVYLAVEVVWMFIRLMKTIPLLFFILSK